MYKWYVQKPRPLFTELICHDVKRFLWRMWGLRLSQLGQTMCSFAPFMITSFFFIPLIDSGHAVLAEPPRLAAFGGGSEMRSSQQSKAKTQRRQRKTEIKRHQCPHMLYYGAVCHKGGAKCLKLAYSPPEMSYEECLTSVSWCLSAINRHDKTLGEMCLDHWKVGCIITNMEDYCNSNPANYRREHFYRRHAGDIRDGNAGKM